MEAIKGDVMRKVLVMAAAAAVSLVAVSAASAATVVVTPTNTHGWSTADTNAGGAVNFVADATAPGRGALQLTTDGTNAARAQYMHAASTALSSVTELSYEAKQNSASFAQGDPSYQLPVCLDGVVAGNCVGFTTLVYEPYWNGAVVTGTWQNWDVDAGQLWSSRTYSNGSCSVVNGAGGPPFYTLAGLTAACPNAVVAGFGVNVGTYNPGYDVEADLVDFNVTTYDFEPYEVASEKDQCKDGGWKDVKRANGSSFKNQGDCIQYVNTGK
jgi:hypothetical protein